MATALVVAKLIIVRLAYVGVGVGIGQLIANKAKKNKK